MKPFIGVAFIFLENYQYIELHQEVENFGEKNLKQKIMYDAYNNIQIFLEPKSLKEYLPPKSIVTSSFSTQKVENYMKDYIAIHFISYLPILGGLWSKKIFLLK